MLRLTSIFVACHGIVAALSPAIWQGVRTGYLSDSFWTLSHIGQIGVATISIVGLGAIAALNAAKTRAILRRSQHRHRIIVWCVDCILSLGVFAAAYVLSPQIFYTLYQQIIPALPDQWVVDNAANWERFTSIIIPRVGATMSDHLAGVAVGGVFLFTTYLHRR